MELGIFFFFILVIYFLTFSFIPGWFWGYKREETDPPAGLCCSSLGCQSTRLQLWCAVKMAACVCVCEKLRNRDSDLTLAPDQRREAQRWDAADDMTAPAGGRKSSLQLWGDPEA